MTASHLKDFEIVPKDVIHFDEGMFGFEDYKDFVIMQEDDDSCLMLLQSIQSEHPAFVVMDPVAIMSDYSPILSKHDKEYFGKDSNLKYLVVTVMFSDVSKTLVNLKSPIAIDVNTNKAKQVFVENEDYPIRYHLFESEQ